MRAFDDIGRHLAKLRPVGPYLAVIVGLSSLMAWGFTSIVSTIAVTAEHALLTASGARQAGSADATGEGASRMASLVLNQAVWPERSRREGWTPPSEPITFPAYSRAIESETPPGRGGEEDTFRTICVRLCDGYQFPISFSTTRSNFGRDAETCESTCGSPARLFVQRHSTSANEPLLDLTGQPYSRLPNADRFRTTFDASCKCTAHPWEDASRDQHRVYALESAVRKGDKNAVPELAESKKRVEESRRQVAEQKRQANSKLASAGTIPPSGGTGATVSAFASRGGSKSLRTAAREPRDGDPLMGLGGPQGSAAAEAPAPTRRRGYLGPLAYGGGWEGRVFQGN
jgi:hypothetical protein